MLRRLTTTALLLLLISCSAFAWSAKEHLIITRIAIGRLIADPTTPPEMKKWLIDSGGKALDLAAEKRFLLDEHIGPFPRGADGIPFWSVTPDLVKDADRRQRVLVPFNTVESKLHFIDLELMNSDPQRRMYADNLSRKPAWADLPHDINDPRYRSAGMLPFAVEVHYANQVRSIRAGRLLDKPGQYPREDHAVKWAGVLAHYLSDNTQPQHATEDFKSQSYFGNGVRTPDIHADVEYRLLDDPDDDYMELRREFWPLLLKALGESDPPTSNDPWKSTIEVALISYDALPMIGRAAKAAYPDAGQSGPGKWRPDIFFHYRGRYLGREMSVMEMKAHQLAWAVHRVQWALTQAWGERAGK